MKLLKVIYEKSLIINFIKEIKSNALEAAKQGNFSVYMDSSRLICAEFFINELTSFDVDNMLDNPSYKEQIIQELVDKLNKNYEFTEVSNDPDDNSYQGLDMIYFIPTKNSIKVSSHAGNLITATRADSYKIIFNRDNKKLFGYHFGKNESPIGQFANSHDELAKNGIY